MLVLSAMGGTTGWHYSITRHARYAPHASNYAGGAAAAPSRPRPGFTAELFFTDDSGLYFFPTRDAGALVDPASEEVTASRWCSATEKGCTSCPTSGCTAGGTVSRGPQHVVCECPAHCLSSRSPTSPST